MQFHSIEFLFGYFPLFLLIYYCAGKRLQMPVLTIASLGFYAMVSGGNYWWVALLLGVSAVTFLIQRFLAGKPRTFLLTSGLVALTGLLAFLKVYRGGALLPAGASFYLFQVAGILIDVYRGHVQPYRNILLYLRDVVMFPKLLSGPIVMPDKLCSMPASVRPSAENIRCGLQTLIIGLFLKVVLANNLGGLWAQPSVIGYAYISVPAAWLAIISFTMQLYLDFYGYSLMAIGIGRMLGFVLPENFLQPYSARSVGDFYRRWHATLGAWFKNYLYIPLGGNRRGTVRTLLNVAVVWLFTGLWHGTQGNYLLWAGFLCLLIINERLWLGKLLERSRVLSHIYVVLVILLSWIPFAIGDWSQMLIFCGRLFGVGGTGLNPTEYVQWLRMYGVLLAVSALMMTPLPEKFWKKIRNSIFADFLLIGIFWVVVYYLSTAQQNPFMYFQY